ncbi:MAG: hypothetical protein AABY15_01990 [Nanoarchaeota archaeon]
MGLFSRIFGGFSKKDMTEMFKEAAKEYASAQAEEQKKYRLEEDKRWRAMDSDAELNEKYLFDFKPQWEGTFGNAQQVEPAPEGMAFNGTSESKDKVQKITKKPIEVVDELGKHPNIFTLTNLEDKIEMMKDKIGIIEQKYAKLEMKGLLERLENRKKYHEFKDFYDKFPNTNMESIDNLLGKYNLVMKPSDLFIPEFPQEAVNVIKSYNETTKKLCGKEPKYYVIAEEAKFQKAYEKRDPILLVQSPFGFYYQILGAWDSEMLIVSQL